MKPRSLIVLKLLFFPIVQVIVLFVLLWLLRANWTSMIKQIEDQNSNLTAINAKNLSSNLQSEIENMTLVLNRSNSSAIDIARVLSSSILNIEGTKFVLYCSPVDVMGIQIVYGFLLPQSELIKFLHKNTTRAQILQISIAIVAIFLVCTLVYKILNSAIVETGLRNALTKQTESTRQAERKSMNKTLAFARASHDIRAPLAGISGLVDISYTKVSRGSELESYLRQIDSCTNDLLGLLNSILDSSKIESGKIQLEEKEFDIAQLVEETVDFYHPVGVEKGIDMILDPCDGSIVKFSSAKGDAVKIKQILSNLLSNAVKFTSEGHVVVRAWVQEPSLKKNSIIASSNKSSGLMRRFFSLRRKNESLASDRDNREAVNSVHDDPNCMEFVFEVDDTGKGIPKEKHKTVFEDYVQVKETSMGKGGTGLGLGIVQSLVRLMSGEIGIVDKDSGEKGSCFRFNVLLSVCDNNNKRENRVELRSLSPKQTSPKVDIRSCVVLLIKNEERRRVSKKFMEGLGIKVFEVEHWKKLSPTLDKIKSEADKKKSSSKSSSGSHSPATNNLDIEANKDRAAKSLLNFVLIVIDVTVGPISKLSQAVAEFRNGLVGNCRVFWLANQTRYDNNDTIFGDTNRDVVRHEPFHGTRMYEAIRLLPEFGGSQSPLHGNVVEPEIQELVSSENSSSGDTIRPWKKIRSPKNPFRGSSCILGSSSSSRAFSPFDHDHKINLLEPHGESSNSSINKTIVRLEGKSFLVVEDNQVLGIVAVKILSNLGAIVDLCTNGKEAFELVSKRLANGKKERYPNIVPYDYILLDCEMPVMNGYETTREIRKLEKLYGVRMPIIGLSGHAADSEEANNAVKAEMDCYLSKPLGEDKLLEAIRSIYY